MDLSLKGKSALVLGSTKGIGYGIAKVLLDQGARVGIVGRDRSNAEKVAKNYLTKYTLRSLCHDQN